MGRDPARDVRTTNTRPHRRLVGVSSRDGVIRTARSSPHCGVCHVCFIGRIEYWLRWLVIMSLPTPMTRLRALRPVPIFRGLTKEELFEVARMTTEVTYPADETVVREGDPGDALYIIVEGTVEIHTGGRVVARMTAGDFFGEISLFDGEPRSATVVAVDDVVLLRLKSSDFETLLKSHYIARTALKSLAQRFRAAQGSHVP